MCRVSCDTGGVSCTGGSAGAGGGICFAINGASGNDRDRCIAGNCAPGTACMGEL